MASSRRPTCSVLLLFAVLLSASLLLPSPSIVLAQIGETPIAEEHALQDVCAPLREAQAILASLQPLPNAHLEHKIGSSITPFSSRGWGDGLGWGHEGPLSTTFRLLPRLINTLFSPKTLLSKVPFLGGGGHTPKRGVKIGRARRDKIQSMLGLMEEAEKMGCQEVWAARGKMRMFPPKGVKQDLPAAYNAYKKYLEHSADPESQFMVGFFHATGLGGVEQDQGKALLYYTFAAVQGYRPASMALGYRHWAGIGVKEDCMLALDHYQVAAEKSYQTYLAGPPGGRTLPLTHTRLSDRVGGVYGPHASWASTGANAHRPAIRATMAFARGETEKEILEYYQYHSDRDSHAYTIRLGRLFYLGSVYFSHAGVSAGAEGVGEIPQDFRKAREYFLKVARVFWPVDFETDGSVAKWRRVSKEMEDSIKEPAMVAAAFLGRMALRGEGGKPDYRRARLWYERAAELGDREAHNGLGIIHRDGLIVPVDRQKAFHFFQAAASQDLAEAQVQLAKLHLDRGEIMQASAYLEVALRHGATFEAFHLLGKIHAANAKTGTRPGMCGVAVAYEKLVAERGNWDEDFVGEADRAWARGEEDKAFVGWSIGAEMGYEAGQNNIAFLLEKGFKLSGSDEPGVDSNGKDRHRALTLWVRSAAQDNVDAMVKVGDYYSDDKAYDRAVAYYQTAADTQTSAMAYWNLGFMYENGQGVPRDWHLAKRFYDLAGETNSEAYLPVILSLIKLYLRSWWIDLRTHGATPGLSLFAPDPNPQIQLSTLDRIKALFTDLTPVPSDERGEYDLDVGYQNEEGLEGEGDDVYEDRSGSGWAQHQHQHQRDRERQQIEDDEVEDLLEDLVLIVVLVGTVGLVWLRSRWAQQEREREERRRREGEAR
ncbi:hypothetical protein I316_00620 [Kwoniella heveanensis BCC8398]|uniref:SEL1 protein n=1 Tax=Kwoniella heveanensis BCC8398 TaxID=1296120 RepID=A0A1B9H2J9_9TREE|nr:hypothetical protein I316_00620 [Kwoniella heveanensis BCC8398]